MTPDKAKIGSLIYLYQDDSTGIIIAYQSDVAGCPNTKGRYKIHWLNDPDSTGIQQSLESVEFIEDCCKVIVP